MFVQTITGTDKAQRTFSLDHWTVRPPGITEQQGTDLLAPLSRLRVQDLGDRSVSRIDVFVWAVLQMTRPSASGMHPNLLRCLTTIVSNEFAGTWRRAQLDPLSVREIFVRVDAQLWPLAVANAELGASWIARAWLDLGTKSAKELERAIFCYIWVFLRLKQSKSFESDFHLEMGVR